MVHHIGCWFYLCNFLQSKALSWFVVYLFFCAFSVYAGPSTWHKANFLQGDKVLIKWDLIESNVTSLGRGCACMDSVHQCFSWKSSNWLICVYKHKPAACKMCLCLILCGLFAQCGAIVQSAQLSCWSSVSLRSTSTCRRLECTVFIGTHTKQTHTCTHRHSHTNTFYLYRHGGIEWYSILNQHKISGLFFPLLKCTKL